jgi:hypothetical protein
VESGSVRRMNRGDKNASSGRRVAWWAVGLSISLGASRRSRMPSVFATMEAYGRAICVGAPRRLPRYERDVRRESDLYGQIL